MQQVQQEKNNYNRNANIDVERLSEKGREIRLENQRKFESIVWSDLVTPHLSDRLTIDNAMDLYNEAKQKSTITAATVSATFGGSDFGGGSGWNTNPSNTPLKNSSQYRSSRENNINSSGGATTSADRDLTPHRPRPQQQHEVIQEQPLSLSLYPLSHDHDHSSSTSTTQAKRTYSQSISSPLLHPRNAEVNSSGGGGGSSSGNSNGVGSTNVGARVGGLYGRRSSALPPTKMTTHTSGNNRLNDQHDRVSGTTENSYNHPHNVEPSLEVLNVYHHGLYKPDTSRTSAKDDNGDAGYDDIEPRPKRHAPN